jgi:hypothetical protein
MRKVAEYEIRAEECRRLAAHMKDPEQKKQLEDMAQAWELLARARLKHLLMINYRPSISGRATKKITLLNHGWTDEQAQGYSTA